MTPSPRPRPHSPFGRLIAAGLALAAIAALTAVAVSRGPSPTTGETAPAPATLASPSAPVTSASPATTGVAPAAPDVKARSGIVIDQRSGKVLWSKSPDLRLAPASCTKIMTALLVLERYDDLGRMITAPGAASDHPGVAIGLRQGDRISVRQALRALMTKSANDACITLATA